MGLPGCDVMEHSLGLIVNQLINISLPLLEPDDPVKYIRQNDITLHVPIVSWSYEPSQRFYHHNLLDILVSADGIASLTLYHAVFKRNKTRAMKPAECLCLKLFEKLRFYRLLHVLKTNSYRYYSYFSLLQQMSVHE